MIFAIQFGLRCTNTALSAWLAQAEMGTALHLHQQHQGEALCTQSFESAGQDDTEKKEITASSSCLPLCTALPSHSPGSWLGSFGKGIQQGVAATWQTPHPAPLAGGCPSLPP